jgi:hypothetical protein
MGVAVIDPRVAPLLSADAVRRQSRILYAAALAGRLEHFTLHLQRMQAAF